MKLKVITAMCDYSESMSATKPTAVLQSGGPVVILSIHFLKKEMCCCILLEMQYERHKMLQKEL